MADQPTNMIRAGSITTHGMTKTRLYKLWTGMKQRCYNPKAEHFEDYGGRGIIVCERWVSSFENFYNDVHEGHKKHLTLERIDANGIYEPLNFKWATRKEQQRNKRNTILLIIDGVSLPLPDWSDISGTNYQTIITRYFRKWSHKECVYGKIIKDNYRVLSINGRSLHIAQWAKESGINAKAITYRINNGWGNEEAVFTPIRNFNNPTIKVA